jgi:hypothetical protein
LPRDVVPQVAKAPGLVAAYWLAPEESGQGMAMVVFESEEQAEAMSKQVEPPPGAPVTIESISIREVVANF